MGREVDVDEHGFIASGVLLAEGVLPYRDYHYNHMPTEVIVYAGLFRVFGHLLLAARAFQALCGAAAAAAIFAVACRAGETFGRRRPAFAWGVGLLFLTNQLFTKTTGLSWNHDFPLLMALLSFLSLVGALRAKRPVFLVALSGILAGLAATSRLTFFPIVAPMGLLILFYPGMTVRSRAGLAAAFVVGFWVAALPAVWVWSRAWENAFFGNVLYPKLNTTIHRMREPRKPYTFVKILGYYLFGWAAMPTTGIAALGFASLAVTRLRRGTPSDPRVRELWALVGVVVLMLVAGMMPAPPYEQYFYAATPFMFVGIAWCAASLPKLWENVTLRRVAIGAGLFAIAFGAPAYRNVVFLPRVGRWVPEQAHAEGVALARALPAGMVLTLEPLYPMEGGMETDPRFAVGRFAPRVADLMTAEQRARYLMPGLGDLQKVLDEDRPGSVLVVHGTGEGQLERQLGAAAEARGYRLIALPDIGRDHRKDDNNKDKKENKGSAYGWVRPER